MSRLPKGITNGWDDSSFWGYTSSENKTESEYKETDLTNKCECGVTVTMGKDDSPEYHSDWCNVKIKWLKEKK